MVHSEAARRILQGEKEAVHGRPAFIYSYIPMLAGGTPSFFPVNHIVGLLGTHSEQRQHRGVVWCTMGELLRATSKPSARVLYMDQ
jgi:hypothetical protein